MSRHTLHLLAAAVLLLSPALGCSEATPGGPTTDTAVETAVDTTVDTAADTLGADTSQDGAAVDADPADTAGPDVAADTSLDGTKDVGVADVADVAPDTAADVAEDTTPDVVADVGGDTAPDVVADVGVDTIDDVISPAALCPVEEMGSLYSGLFPPNPYASWPPAPGCVSSQHDVIVVFGCPNKDDGAPDNCQTKRADIAVALAAEGYGDKFIVSGGAVYNQYVEAETLRDLLVARGVAPEAIWLEPQAEHTDENIYFSTKIMQAQGWESALMVSNDPGHLMMTALCDSNCCVDLGRLTVFEVNVAGEGQKVGHYALYPHGKQVNASECSKIGETLKAMCIKLDSRKACKDDFQLPL